MVICTGNEHSRSSGVHRKFWNKEKVDAAAFLWMTTYEKCTLSCFYRKAGWQNTYRGSGKHAFIFFLFSDSNVHLLQQWSSRLSTDWSQWCVSHVWRLPSGNQCRSLPNFSAWFGQGRVERHSSVWKWNREAALMDLGKAEAVKMFLALHCWNQAARFHHRSTSEVLIVSPWEPTQGGGLAVCSIHSWGLDAGCHLTL